MRAALILVVAVTLPGCAAEQGPPAVDTPRMGPERITPIPGSIFSSALVGADTLCSIDRYQRHIQCVDSAGGLWSFGREGPGPGELTSPFSIAHAGDRLVVNDRNRLSVFTTAGVFVRSIPTDEYGWLMVFSRSDDTVTGWRTRADQIDVETGDVVLGTSVDGGEVTCSAALHPRQSKIAAPIPVSRGALYMACMGEYLLWYPDESGDAVVVRSPTYRERFAQPPTPRVDGDVPLPSISEQDRALPWYGYGGVDEDGRLWLPWRDGSTFADTYDLLPRLAFTGTVDLGVRGDLLVSGDRLAMVVRDSLGLDANHVHWFRVP